MLNNDLIFASNRNDAGHYSVYLYGFKSNGEKYFITKPAIEYSQFNSVGIKIDNNDYPLVCSKENCFIFDLENEEIYFFHFFQLQYYLIQIIFL